MFSVSAELCKKGFDVDIITQQPDEKVDSLSKFDEGFKVYRIPRSKIPKTGLIWRWIWLLLHLKLVWKADIIHFYDFDVLIKWFLPFRFIFLRKKYFITFHGYEGFPLRYRHILYRKIAEKITHGNICVGEFIKRWYRTKPDIIYYAAVHQSLVEAPKQAGKDIVFIGRLEKDTDLMNYLEAVNLFYKKTGCDAPFKILGSGLLKNKMTEYLKTNNIPYEYLGSEPNPEKYLKNARVVLASSYLSILESLALGKIVIAFYSNNLKRDYLKSFPGSDKAFFVTESIKETASLLSSVYSNPEKYNDMITSGLDLAKELTWDRVADKYISLYKKNGHNEG